MVLNQYDIQPTDNPPDFGVDVGDKSEKKYIAGMLLGLSVLYTKYGNKTADYALKHISTDLSKLKSNMDVKINGLENVFDDTVTTNLTKIGILKENVPKAGIKSNLIKNTLNEQRSTLKGIIGELEQGIKSKAHYLKSRANDKMFNLQSTVNRAISRTKAMAESGYRNAKARAEREAKVFLYGDPMASWVTENDDKVCDYCFALQEASPMPLSKMPFCPLHNHCRCEIIEEYKDIDLTSEALALTMYETGDLI